MPFAATTRRAMSLRTVGGTLGLVLLITAAILVPSLVSTSTTHRLEQLAATADAAEQDEPIESASEEEASRAVVGTATSSPRGLIALAAAYTQSGKPYEWGGTGPDTWDCSGLVQWAFGEAGVDLPRVSEDQALVGEWVPIEQMAPGDVITFRDAADHVGIYAGGDQVFNAYDDSVPIGLTSLADLPPIHNVQRF